MGNHRTHMVSVSIESLHMQREALSGVMMMMMFLVKDTKLHGLIKGDPGSL